MVVVNLGRGAAGKVGVSQRDNFAVDYRITRRLRDMLHYTWKGAGEILDRLGHASIDIVDASGDKRRLL